MTSAESPAADGAGDSEEGLKNQCVMGKRELKVKKRFRRRYFQGGEVHHIYQRTVNRFNIFYDMEDYLVYYTIFAVAAGKCDVVVLGLCLMFDHIHMLLKAEEKAQMSEFVRMVTSMFAREQNNDLGRSGALFQARFGSAAKIGLKQQRTAIAYLFNNPVEKALCPRAEEFRWNFLAYAITTHPFSDAIVTSTASHRLRNALKEVGAAKSEGRHLRYGQLRRMLNRLNERERSQLVDYIISVYNCIDYHFLTGCYGSYQDMLLAVNSNTGSEYDIKEERFRFSDMEYVRIADILRREEGVRTLSEVTAAAIDEKFRLFDMLRHKYSCYPQAIIKFLRMDVKKL